MNLRSVIYLILVLALLAALQSTAHGQTLSPLNAECQKKCNGHFTITNDTIRPLVVSVTPLLFSFNDAGTAVFRETDKTVDIQLNTMSAKLAPKEIYQFDYKIRCLSGPTCMVAFANAMMLPDKIREGLSMRIILAEIVYVCEKEKGCRLSLLPKKLTPTATPTAAGN